MVESQLRADNVTDRRILAAFAALPRERFVPPVQRELAYSDASLQVWPSLDGGPARFLLPPVVLARLIQLASVEANDAVLDIGCATGYSAAVLSRLVRSVTAIEAEPELAAAARENLRALGIGNATVLTGGLALGAPEAGPFEVILLNGSVPEVPPTLLAQLKEGRRLCAIVAADQGRPRQGKATLFVKTDGETSGLPHFDANARQLPGFAPSPSFTF
jgi:protein-L-isoaspartate(D-aspartate) O-methyltransferase